MNNHENFEFDDSTNNEQPILEGKKNTQVRKRKWREIESLKEKRRLRREIDDYSLYSF
ncbi:MAG: hypothetical protein ACI9LM_000549 [Alteromonadaceae bacterium]|jgi:hypothetical protein